MGVSFRLRNFELASDSVDEVNVTKIYIMVIRVISVSIWRFLSRLNILIRATPVSTTLHDFMPGTFFGDNYEASCNSSAGVQSLAYSYLTHFKQSECVMHGDSEHASSQGRLHRLPKRFNSAVSHLNGRFDEVLHYSKVLQEYTIVSTWTNGYALAWPHALLNDYLGERLCPYFIQAMNLSLLAHSCMAQTHEVHQQYSYKHPHHPLLHCRHYHNSTLTLAGHNKWSKIKHKKKATDLEKSKNIQKYMTLIVSAIKTGGGADPDANIRLASVMEAARKAGNLSHFIPLKYLHSNCCVVM